MAISTKKVKEKFGFKEISGDPAQVADMIKTIAFNLASMLDAAKKYDAGDSVSGDYLILGMAEIKKQVTALTGEPRKPAGLLKRRMYQLHGTVDIKSGKYYLAKNEERPLDMDINK